MDWNTKATLIMKDPVTVVQYFTNRYKQFKDLVIVNYHEPMHKVTNHFLHYEFATHGSIHIHMIALTEGAPIHGKKSNEEIATYHDNSISCSKDLSVENQQYIKGQVHCHSRKGCQMGNTSKCCFGFPIPPMSRNQVLEPIDFEDKDTGEHLKHL